jgi:hypothetical protein
VLTRRKLAEQLHGTRKANRLLHPAVAVLVNHKEFKKVSQHQISTQQAATQLALRVHNKQQLNLP